MRIIAACCALMLLAGCTQEQAQRFVDGMHEAQDPSWSPPSDPMPYGIPGVGYQLPVMQSAPVAPPQLITTTCQPLYGTVTCQTY